VRSILALAVLVAGCADRPEEVSAGKFRVETERAQRQEAAADLVASATWQEQGGSGKRGEPQGEYRNWKVLRPLREGLMTEDEFWTSVQAYSGPKRLAVVILGPRDVRTQDDLDRIQEAIKEMHDAFRAAGFERAIFQQQASFGRTILRE
jgi:hypothetical protein